MGDAVNAISSFRGDYRFLSNFYPCDVQLDNITYSSTEHAYQAAKTTDPFWRKVFYQLPLVSAGQAKRLGRELSLRNDWESVKLGIMEDLLRQKFNIPDLKEKLLETETAQLIEGNNWGDVFWGVDDKKGGQNHLGKLLMKVRAEYKMSRVLDFLSNEE